MRTETKTYNVYTFDELSDDAKQKAHADYLQNGDYWSFGRQANNTMKEIEKLFHVTLKNWCIDTYNPKYPDIEPDEDFWEGFTDREEWYSRLNLKGNRARAFLWNNFGHVLTSPRYYGKKCLKHSHFFTTRVYDGTCPLTGIYFDCCALDHLAYFCFGTKWNEKEKRRTMTTDRTIWNDDQTTVWDVIEDCVRSMFKSFIDDLEYAESREHFAANCEANGWEFLEDGTMF